ncbi:MAG: PRD domain-containing protein [Longicatena sp.]|nr:PRD domain-containing protein [Longicatena sp.]
MYLIEKVLNHNSILVSKKKKNYLVLEKGIGFQKKANQVIQLDEDITMYLLEDSNRGTSREIIERIEVKYLELANRILELAKHFLGNIDQNILLALADHIAFAIERMSHGLKISNPYASEIRLLNPDEYEVALQARNLIFEETGYEFDEEELGYITLHLHCAKTSEQVDTHMQVAIIVNESLKKIESRFQIKIDVNSLSYSRLMTHIRYMIARIKKNEALTIDMDEFVKNKFPEAYEVAQEIVIEIAKVLKYKIERVEVGYLALHIQRVCEI